MSEFQTSYYKFDSPNENDNPVNEEAYLMHVPDRNKALWHHIQDLDSFFIRVYQYHQNHGFLYILSQICLELLEFVFIVGLLTFLSSCVNYDVLFANNLPANSTGKVSIDDVVYSSAVCSSRISKNSLLILFLIVASSVFAGRCIRILNKYFQLREIRRFFRMGLRIKKEELNELTWQEVQQRLILVQEEQQMCIHKQHLTELDIYNRILRFKNYIVAMVNKGLLPPRFQLPFLGDTVFFTEGLKFNIELIFFRGPRAIFVSRFHLKDEFKVKAKREDLAERLSKDILILGLINLFLSPFIFFWQVWYTFLSYTDLLKREPGAFSARTWSLYARHYFRHFNELPHEFQGRLNRGYKHAKSYMESFNSPILSLYAKTVAFIAGSFLAVLVLLTIWDFDVLEVEHLFALGAGLTFVVHICRTLIPDENASFCPEQLMRRVIAQVHYAPDSWRGHAHTYNVRDQFAQLFQYKAVYILEELLSPIVTPFVLIFWMRKRSLQIVDFFRHFTVDIAGVGDVCSFAQMDINKHGDPKWHDTSGEDPVHVQKADDGKVELSLMRFAVTNPKWVVPKDEDKFLTTVKRNLRPLPETAVSQNHLISSVNSDPNAPPETLLNQFEENIDSYLPGYGKGADFNPSLDAAKRRSVMSPSQSADVARENYDPRFLHPSSALHSPLAGLTRSQTADRRRELTSMELSMSALFMHEMHHQRLSDHHNRMMWETIPDQSEDEEGLENGSRFTSTQRVVSDPNEAAQIFPTSSGLVQQGYDSMSNLTAADIFGNLAENEPNNRNLSKTSFHEQTTKPFLSVPTDMPTDGGDCLPVDDNKTLSRSAISPQEFNTTQSSYQNSHRRSLFGDQAHTSESAHHPPQV